MLLLASHIFVTSIIPILLLIAGGFTLDKLFKLDLRTLSKLNFYVLLPAFIFQSLYTAHIGDESLEIGLCALVIIFSNSLLVSLVGYLIHYDKRRLQIIRNGVMFNNSGNIGVAIATFVFSNTPYVINGATPYVQLGIVSVISIFIVQTVFCNTLGFYQAGLGQMTAKEALRMLLRMPIIYVAPLAVLCKFLPFHLTSYFFWPPIHYYGIAYVGISMLTVGVELSRSPINFIKWDVLLAAGLRLLAGPLVAAGIALLFIHFYGALQPISAQAIIMTYSIPSGVSTALIAYETHNNPEFATQITMATTVFSAITMPLAILFAYYMFPL